MIRSKNLLSLMLLIVLTACTTPTPIPPTASQTPLPPTATFTAPPPTSTDTATLTETASPVPPTSTNTATLTPLPPTATLTNTPLPLPTNTQVPATVGVQATAVPATATSAPASSSSGSPTITGVSLVSREPQSIVIAVTYVGLQPNQKYNTIAFAPDCPANCGRYGIIHSGLFNYFTPTSSDWTVQLKVGIDSIFCDGGNSTASNSITVDLAIGVSFGPDFSANFPLPNTWCV